MKKIKLVKVEEARYKCKAVYEWEDNTIYGDDCCISGDSCYWYCEPLFEGHKFRTLKGIRLAIELYLDKDLDKCALEYCKEF